MITPNKAMRELEQRLRQIDDAISAIDQQMANTLSSIDEPTVLVDRVVHVASNLQEARETADRYESDREKGQRVKTLKVQLSAEKSQVVGDVQAAVNSGIEQIVRSVFGNDRKSPRLTLRENNYSYEVYDDTGTGTAYASLIVLDLTVFLATQLPALAHDSLLFKNIENDSVARLLGIYMQTEKQSFIALDEISKYGTVTADLLRSRSVIQLDNAHVLFVKDWRR